VLSHAHNVDSTLELREEISGDECALDEKDAIVTHARLLSENRISLLILASGLALYMAGLVVGTSKNFVEMVVVSAGMLALGLGTAALWIKVGTKRVSWQTREATRSEDAEISDQ
jgi:hypothetical protein